MKKHYGADLTFQQYLDLTNVGSDFAMQRMENHLETGDANKGDGIDGNNLNNNRHVSSATNQNGQMFQTEDKEGYFEVDWDTGAVSYTNDKKEAAAALGLDTDNCDFDTIVFGYGTAEITDFVFNGLDDGQDRTEYNVNGLYKNIQYAVQEFDPCYILDSSLQNMSDPEYQKALHNWEYLSATASQWMSDSDLAKLAELEPNSAEYKQALIDIILSKLDQTSSFTDHDHVKVPTTGDTTDVTDGNINKPPEEAGTVPDYDLDNILQATGLSSQYMGNEDWRGAKHYDNDTCKESSLKDARQYVDEQLTNVMNAMIAEMGDKCTPEIKSYLLKAKNEVLGSPETGGGVKNLTGGAGALIWKITQPLYALGVGKKNSSGIINYETFGGGLFQDFGAQAKVNVKQMIDVFLNNFERLCETKGKTQADIDKDNAEKEKYKNDYKTFYNTNIKSASMGVPNIKSEYTVPMMGGNYKEEAQNKVLTPYANKIISTVKGKCPNLSEAQIKAIVDKAMNNTISDDSWLTTNGNISNGGTYSINTDKLLDSFAQNIKDAIVSAGYDPNS